MIPSLNLSGESNVTEGRRWASKTTCKQLAAKSLGPLQAAGGEPLMIDLFAAFD
jgi:hypothetical protein